MYVVVAVVLCSAVPGQWPWRGSKIGEGAPNSSKHLQETLNFQRIRWIISLGPFGPIGPILGPFIFITVECDEACQKKGDEICNNFEETRKDSISKSAIFFRNKKHKISTGVKCYEVGTYVKIIYVLKNTNTLHSCAVSRNSRKLL